jgi:ribokinase
MARAPEEVHVVVVGSANFDLVVQAPRLPKEGESLLASNLKFFSGGKGANQAVAVRRQGAATTFLGAVGKDMIGDFLLRGMASGGVSTEWVKRSTERTTGCAWISLYPSGNNSIVVDPGANYTLAPEDIERAAEAIAAADALLTVLEVPIKVVETALRIAREAGKLTVLDAGPPRGCPPEVLKLADIVSPNETEAEALTGTRVTGRDSAAEAARKLVALGAKTVVLKLGSDGAMLLRAGEENPLHFPAHPVNAVDPTAAGDAFTAVLTVEMARGVALEEAIRTANAAGALAVTKLGAQPSLPTRQETETFLAGKQK